MPRKHPGRPPRSPACAWCFNSAAEEERFEVAALKDAVEKLHVSASVSAETLEEWCRTGRVLSKRVGGVGRWLILLTARGTKGLPVDPPPCPHSCAIAPPSKPARSTRAAA